jgi:hypothetical protein
VEQARETGCPEEPRRQQHGTWSGRRHPERGGDEREPADHVQPQFGQVRRRPGVHRRQRGGRVGRIQGQP